MTQQNSTGTSLVAFSQSIEKRAKDKFDKKYAELQAYAKENNIRSIKKGDLLSRFIMKPELMEAPAADYFAL